MRIPKNLDTVLNTKDPGAVKEFTAFLQDVVQQIATLQKALTDLAVDVAKIK